MTIAEYKIREKLYESGNSIVYSGTRQTDALPVVFKILNTASPTPRQVVQFNNEYEFTKDLDIPGIRQPYLKTRIDQHDALILEYVDGETLHAAFIEQRRDLKAFLTTAIRIARIVGDLHQHNIIHKDINPSNILVNLEKDEIHLIDFGIASKLTTKMQHLGNPETLEGTLAYISPEQTGRMNRVVDYRTDLYSLGVTFYEMLTGKLPFEAEDAIGLVHCHLAKTPVPPCEIHSPGPPQGENTHPLPLPGEELVHQQRASYSPLEGGKGGVLRILSDIIMKLLAKNAEDRYQSAYGLKADLEWCLRTANGLVCKPTPGPSLRQAQDTAQEGIASEPLAVQRAPFTVGQHDFSDRFQIPQKLYGREEELDTLMQAFDRVSQGNKELLLVTGYAGVGKSALVHELHKPMTARRGHFISGKFDQFQRNIPYSALTHAFNQLCNSLLTEPPDTLARWKTNILEAIGNNGQVLIDVIPRLELVIGKQPAVADVGPQESLNRFNLYFQFFMRAISGAEHPLVLFIDDLQWADFASLNLLKLLLTDPQSHHLLVIGAYRDNEVAPVHPLMRMIEEIEEAGSTIERIQVENLGHEDVSALVEETLGSKNLKEPVLSPVLSEVEGLSKDLEDLSGLVYKKTLGNAFFVTQFLISLNEEEFLTFDFEQRQWTWDLDQIHAKGITDNVVELMVGKIRKLSPATQDVFTLAACIGNTFDLHTLSVIREWSVKETLEEVLEGIEEGLIVPLDDRYMLVTIEGEHDTGEPPEFRFVHDRVQQAAYSLIDKEQRKTVHLRIGRLLLTKTPKEDVEERIFDIVNYFNQGRELVMEKTERIRMAELNLLAARKARDSTAYQLALIHCTVGIELLPQNSWELLYSLTFALYRQRYECEYLTAHFDQAEKLFVLLLAKVKSKFEKAELYNIRIVQYTMMAKYEDAIRIGRDALKLFGIDLPEYQLQTEAEKELQGIPFNLGKRKITDLIHLPIMTEQKHKESVKLLVNLRSPAFLCNPDLFRFIIGRIVNITLKYGNVPESSYGYAAYGVILGSGLGDYQSGYEFGKLGIQLSDQFNDATQKCRTCFIFAHYINHWRMPMHSNLPFARQAIHYGLESGELLFAGYSFAILIHTLISKGHTLNSVLEHIDKAEHFAQKTKSKIMRDECTAYRQFILNLQEQITDSSTFHDKNFQELQFQKEAKDNPMPLCYFYIFKLQTLYLYENYVGALNMAKNAERILAHILGTLLVAEHNFYYSLTLAALYPLVNQEQQQHSRKTLRIHQEQMKRWGDNCPENFLHKYLLVEAEIARFEGRKWDAVEYYRKANEEARKYEFVQNEALSNELTAKFWIAQGEGRLAQMYMNDAHHAYQRWGAMAKVKDLEERYPEFFAKTPQQPGTSITMTSTATSTGTKSEALDLATIMKASQTLSGEIQLERLLQRLMQIVIENAGAEHGFLLLPKEETWYIQAEGHVDKEQVEVLQGIPLQTCEVLETSQVSVGIVNYVIRAQEPVVLHDVQREGDFTRDEYITTHQVKSVLCLPLINQGKLNGILYLENNVTTGAFTPDRIEVLNLLSSQAAISIENATLYASLETALARQTDLTKASQRFVPFDFLKILGKDSIVDVSLGDQIRGEMTILFSDIRAYTTLSETMTPQEVFNFTNGYHKRMTPVIRANHGFVQQFQGDGTVAVFPGTADDAIRAAIEIQHAVQAYDREREQKGRQPIRVGIGLHTGPLMIGIIGDAERWESGVPSDTVNTAARMEGLTKFYGVSVVISEDTLKRVTHSEQYHLRFLDRVQVKGKTHVVGVYELYESDPEPVYTLKKQTQADFEEGQQHYFAKEFAEAIRCFQHVLDVNSDDKTVKLYLDRATHYLSTGVPDDWHGIERRTTK